MVQSSVQNQANIDANIARKNNAKLDVEKHVETIGRKKFARVISALLRRHVSRLEESPNSSETIRWRWAEGLANSQYDGCKAERFYKGVDKGDDAIQMAVTTTQLPPPRMRLPLMMPQQQHLYPSLAQTVVVVHSVISTFTILLRCRSRFISDWF